MAITLASVARNTPQPPRIIIHGDAGIGKTTFGACAPDPIFIQTEAGLGNLDAASFPLASSFVDVMDAIGALYSELHEYKTCVIDSLDWLEPLIWKHVCQRDGKPSIESYGYGKGYAEALDTWLEFFEGITALRNERQMMVIMIAHSEMRRVEDPLLPAYDTHTLKLHKRASALAEEFADVILFASMQTNMITEDAGFNKTRSRAITTGGRIMHTVGQPAFTAKNRYALPTPLPLTWDAFSQAMGYTDAAAPTN